MWVSIFNIIFTFENLTLVHIVYIFNELLESCFLRTLMYYAIFERKREDVREQVHTSEIFCNHIKTSVPLLKGERVEIFINISPTQRENNLKKERKKV